MDRPTGQVPDDAGPYNSVHATLEGWRSAIRAEVAAENANDDSATEEDCEIYRAQVKAAIPPHGVRIVCSAHVHSITNPGQYARNQACQQQAEEAERGQYLEKQLGSAAALIDVRAKLGMTVFIPDFSAKSPDFPAARFFIYTYIYIHMNLEATCQCFSTEWRARANFRRLLLRDSPGPSSQQLCILFRHICTRTEKYRHVHTFLKKYKHACTWYIHVYTYSAINMYVHRSDMYEHVCTSMNKF